MKTDQNSKKSINAEKSSLVLKRLKFFASLAMVTTSMFSSPVARASVPPSASIGDRVAKVREAIEENSNKPALHAGLKFKEGQTLLAQWGNQWANWNNWNNWHNWYNWNNWTNWGNF